MTNVGEVTGPRTFSPSPIPCVSVVLPAPSRPVITSRSPARSSPASRTPSSRMSRSVGTVTVMPFTRSCPSRRALLFVLCAAGTDALDQPAQASGDHARVLQRQHVPGLLHLYQLGARQRRRDAASVLRRGQPVPAAHQH